MKKYHIYTDGSCRKNGKEGATGAYGFVIVDDSDRRIVDHVSQATAAVTNQQMELLAALDACREAEKLMTSVDSCEFHLYTDSAYLHNCVTDKWYKKWQINGWVNSKKQPVANRELWERLIPYFIDPMFIFHKVTGHADNKWNNYVDNLVQARSLGGVR